MRKRLRIFMPMRRRRRCDRRASSQAFVMMQNGYIYDGSSLFVHSAYYLAVSLYISSSQLSPETITRVIGIEPSYTRERGAPTRTGLMRQPEFDLYEWQFREQMDMQSGDDLSRRSEQFINQFLAKLTEAAPKVRELSTDQDVLVQIVYSVSSMPYVGLTSGHIQNIASLGARLDYDIMVDNAPQ